MHSKKQRSKWLYLNLFIVVVLIIAVGVAYMYRGNIRTAASTVTARLSSSADSQFPTIQTVNLSDSQLKLLKILQDEYAKKPLSFDVNVLKYSDGERQPWCANFVSWTMREAGYALTNPHSGSWRIPGVYTLREYFQARNRYELAGDYTPTFGDVAIYAKTPTNSHTNIVLSVDTKAKTMTLIGGNENGRVRIIRNQSYALGVRNLAGFGVRQVPN
jgi:hypothetical protein